jgi:acetyl-CoA decarbonylase/synthase complex subunit gamma
MDDAEIERRCEFVKNFEIERIGKQLRMQGISLRSASNDAEKFRNAAKKISEKFSGVVMLASFNPEILRAGCEILKGKKPLLYAANSDNWKEVFLLAKEYDTAIVAHAKDINELGTLTRKISSQNFHNIILDPGITARGSGLGATIDLFAEIRKSAISNVPELRYPIMGVPAVVHLDADKTEDENRLTVVRDIFIVNDKKAKNYYESLLSAILMNRFASMLVIHSTESWSLLPLLYLDLNVYTDPRVEPKVEAKLYEIGKVDENSPVLVSTNYALTYFALTGDLEGANFPCYILVVDTEGLAVLVAVAAAKLTGKLIKESLEANKLPEKVKHKTMILPGYCSSITGQVEDETGWTVMLGPQDSSMLGKFLKEHWPPKESKK